MLRAPFDTSPTAGLAPFSARDEFNQSTGALTGKVLPVGGTWTVVTGSDADDFSVVSGATAQRTSTGVDTGTGILLTTGRSVTAGSTNYTAIAAQVDMRTNTAGSLQYWGLVMRVGDADDLVQAAVSTGGSIQLHITVGGVVVSQFYRQDLDSQVANAWYTLKALITAEGQFAVWFQLRGALDTLWLTGYDPTLATGGSRATGRVGFGDYIIAGSPTRDYDNFSAWVPTRDAVINASRSLQLATDGAVRETPTGSTFGPVSEVTRDLPRLPVSGQEQRPVQVMFKPSRGEFATVPDSGIDDVSVRGFYRRCWLFVPDLSFNLLDLSGLELWLRPEALGGAGSAMASWRDASGVGGDAVQATGSAQPSVAAAVLDGYSAARFDGAGDFMTVPGITNSDATRTIFVVVRRNGNATGGRGRVFQLASSAAVTDNDAGTAWWYTLNQAGGTQAIGTHTVGNFNLLTIRYNSTSSCDIYVNGDTAGVTNFDPNDNYQAGGTTLFLGRDSGGVNNFLNADMVEFAMFDGPLNTTNRNRAWGYFSRKFPTLGSFGT